MSTKFRFLTVKKEFSEILWNTLVSQVAILTINNVYDHLVEMLHSKKIPHNDLDESHHCKLPNQGGFFSVYYDPTDKTWKPQYH
jgi:hypothetical protein